MDCTLHDSFKSGQWSAHHVWDGEDVPSVQSLQSERMETLRDEWPEVDEAELEAHATAWAAGWLYVVRIAR